MHTTVLAIFATGELLGLEMKVKILRLISVLEKCKWKI